MCLFSRVASVQHVYVQYSMNACMSGQEEGREESLLLFCSDVSLLLWRALHTRHLHIALQLGEGQTQVQALDGDQRAPLHWSCHRGHLHRKEKIMMLEKKHSTNSDGQFYLPLTAISVQ